MIRVLLAVLVSFGLAACAASPVEQNSFDSRETKLQKFISESQLEPVDSVNVFSIRGWQSIGDKHLLVSHRKNQYLLLTLRHRCFDLNYSVGIGIDRMSSSRLSSKFDSVFVPRYPKRKCDIETIRVLSAEQKEMLIKSLSENATKMLIEQ